MESGRVGLGINIATVVQTPARWEQLFNDRLEVRRKQSEKECERVVMSRGAQRRESHPVRRRTSNRTCSACCL